MVVETHLKIYSIFVNLAFVLIVALRVVEHDVDVAHEMINRLVFLSLLLSLCDVRSFQRVELREHRHGNIL